MAEKKIFAIEYACEPNRGSEPGVGWNWSKIISETPGYKFTVLTRANNKPVIDAYKKDHPELKVDFEYIDLSDRWLKHKHGDKHIKFFYTLWQKKAIKYIKNNFDLSDYDLIWDFNFGSLNLPMYTYKLKKKYIVGPVSTKTNMPKAYEKRMSFLTRVKSSLNQFLKNHLWLNRAAWKNLKSADKVIVCDKAYKKYLPKKQQENAWVVFHNGIDEMNNQVPVAQTSDKLKFIYSGRITYDKNLETAIWALRMVKDKEIDFELKVFGDGASKENVTRLVDKLNLSEEVSFESKIPQQELFEEYKKYNYFLFPSLLEISSTAVMEAMYFGLTPICFDIQGMGNVLNGSPAVVLPVNEPKADAEKIAEAISKLDKTNDKQKVSDYAKEHYLWKSREKDIKKVLENI